jgi:hypothetical protein
VAGALAGHQGLGRVVVTSRRVPAGLDARLRVVGVDALSLDEALLLARELPHLSALIDGDISGIDPQTARVLAAGVLEVAQGHPKLLELADGQAARPDRLRTLVEAAGEVWQEAGGLPDGFFATGESSAGGDDFLQVLGAWTRAAVRGLTSAGRDLFCFLCCLEEDDRTRPVLEGNWADLWQRLGRDGEAPSLDGGLGELAAAGLATVPPGGKEFGVHPGVAAAGRDLAGDAFREAADTELAAYWAGAADYAVNREADQDTGGLVIRAGLSAAPYLLRLHAWIQARSLLEHALIRDKSRATAGAALPALRAIAAAVAGTDSELVALGDLARALERMDPAVGEQQTAAVLATALDRQDYWTASTSAGYLVAYRLAAGRLGEALQLAEDKAGYTRQAGLGPWTQLGDQVRRLQILESMGQARQVLDEVQRLRNQMDGLSTASVQPEANEPWDVQETLLDIGQKAAKQLGLWAEALELSGAEVASMRGRGAPDSEIASVQVNNYGPLLRLGRLDDAVALLITCREVFERTHDIRHLGTVLSALADTEDERGHGDVAIVLERDALRYKYLVTDMGGVQVSHHNLGNYLLAHAEAPQAALPHHLAAALLRVITGAEGAERSMRAAAGDLRLGGEAAMPASAAALCLRVGEVPGVHLDRLLATLAPEAGTAEQVLGELVDRVRADAAATVSPAVAEYLAAWDPVIAGLAAAARGDADAGTAVREHLARYADSDDWAGLAGALTQILDGHHGEDLTADLDYIDTAIITRAQDALAGRVSLPTLLWSAMDLGQLVGDIIAAARGRPAAPQRARQVLDDLAGIPEWAGLAAALDQILGGKRDPALADALDDPTGQAVVACVLEHIGARAEKQEEGT